MAFAEVVSRFAIANAIDVAAYAAATGAIRQFQPRRAPGSTASRTTAATPARKQATCQPVRVAALMAAPPVENRIAAATSSSRLRSGETLRWAGAAPARTKPSPSQPGGGRGFGARAAGGKQNRRRHQQQPVAKRRSCHRRGPAPRAPEAVKKSELQRNTEEPGSMTDRKSA